MSHPATPKSLEALRKFTFERLLNEDPLAHSLTLLGEFPDPENPSSNVKAVVRVEKTALDPADAPKFFGESGFIKTIELEQSTDIYSWLFAWLGESRDRDLKINIVCPATEVHIRKYTKQEYIMVHETPALYEQYVRPYIQSFPPSRTQWVENILTGLSEQDKILYSSPEFLILPDMKWDAKTIGSLYLMALVQDRTIRSLRDLRRHHLGLLKAIRTQAFRIVKEKWGLPNGSLRMFIHYQPSYYHFHIHIVNANYLGNILGMTVGQAHLLDDVMGMLELDPADGPGIFERITLTYGLGDQHGLFEALKHTAIIDEF